MIFIYLLVFIISCVFLALSGSRIIKSLIKIAKFLGWKEFIVSSLLMAFATSLPEFFVSVSAAIHKQPQLAIGNILGSNIIVLTLVIGIGALMSKRLRFQGRILQWSSLYAAFSASLPLILMLDHEIGRIDGLILLSCAFFYFYLLISEGKRYSKVVFNKIKTRNGFFSFFRSISSFFVGIFLLLISAEGIVWSATSLALNLNLPLLFIGMFVIALGTSIPEIAFGIKAVTSGHKSMIIGNSIGSVVANSSLILGIVSLIYPIKIDDFLPYFPGILFTALASFLFAVFARTGREITRKEGIVLLFVYILFVISQIVIS